MIDKLIKKFFDSEDWSDLSKAATISFAKKEKRRGSQDFGFECLIHVKLGAFFLRELQPEFVVFVGEQLADISIKPDIALLGPEKLLLEIKVIIDNNFSWLNSDINKLIGIPEFSRYLLIVNFYMSKRALKNREHKLRKYVRKRSLNILVDKKFYEYQVNEEKYPFFYALFKI